jgi:hypothetical protein
MVVNVRVLALVLVLVWDAAALLADCLRVIGVRVQL